jgi:trehalose-6-phosphatase
MGKDDMQIAGRVRGILGKHFLDLDPLHIACTKGVVRIVGEFKRIGQLAEIMPITEKILHDLKTEIKRLPGVKRVLVADEPADD